VPRAPWGSFPLTELVVLLALVCGVAGLVRLGHREGGLLLGAALVLGCLGGLEIAVREHFAGRRSRAGLIGASVAAAASAGALAAGLGLLVAAVAAVLLGGGTALLLRRAHARRRRPRS
jgi:hypothetical protein